MSQDNDPTESADNSSLEDFASTVAVVAQVVVEEQQRRESEAEISKHFGELWRN